MKSASRQFAFFCAISTVLLFPLKSVCENTNRTKAFNNYKHGFSITFPENWNPMPDEKMAFLNDNAAKAHPGWRKPALHYGYQQKDSQDFVFPPFVWIRVMELDHLPTLEFTRAELIRDNNQEGGVAIGDPVFDSESGAFFAESELNFEGREPAKGAIAFFPTRKSLIKVFCFAARSDAEKDPQLLRQMFSGVRIYGDYETAGAKRSPTGLVVSIIAIGIMVLVMLKSKPAKSHSEDSPAKTLKSS